MNLEKQPAFCSALIASAIAEAILPGELNIVATLLTAVGDQLALIAACNDRDTSKKTD